MNRLLILNLLILFAFFSCTSKKKDDYIPKLAKTIQPSDTVIIDCNYTFQESVEGSNAPLDVIDQLQLINVQYYSIDGKIHAGQVLTNKKIVNDIFNLFEYMLHVRFPIAKVIPIVNYKWNDIISMHANNSYSFCYRDASYSKHAYGMAIDINPYFNPVRWKIGYQHRLNKPFGAVYNPKIPGTFYPTHPVVLEFKKHGFRWGHNFTRNYDDHHFEK